MLGYAHIITMNEERCTDRQAVCYSIYSLGEQSYETLVRGLLIDCSQAAAQNYENEKDKSGWFYTFKREMSDAYQAQLFSNQLVRTLSNAHAHQGQIRWLPGDLLVKAFEQATRRSSKFK